MIFKIFIFLLSICIISYVNSHLVPIQDFSNDLIPPSEDDQYPEVVKVLLSDFIYNQTMTEMLRDEYTYLLYRRY